MVASLLEEGADERRQDAANETQQEFCFGLPGAIAPAGEFDPAGLLRDRSKAEVYRWRESELTHGRVAMLASAGFLVRAPCSNPSPSPSPSPNASPSPSPKPKPNPSPTPSPSPSPSRDPNQVSLAPLGLVSLGELGAPGLLSLDAPPGLAAALAPPV